jgi:hypothetical protein
MDPLLRVPVGNAIETGKFPRGERGRRGGLPSCIISFSLPGGRSAGRRDLVPLGRHHVEGKPPTVDCLPPRQPHLE